VLYLILTGFSLSYAGGVLRAGPFFYQVLYPSHFSVWLPPPARGLADLDGISGNTRHIAQPCVLT